MLRVAIGITMVLQGVVYFTDSVNLNLMTGAVGLLMVICGAALLAGFVTPVAACIALVASTGSVFSWFPVTSSNLFAVRMVAVNLVTMAVAVLCLGPGAFSLDAYLFGRREIIIPHASRPPES